MDKKIIKIGLAMMTCMSVLWSDSKLLLADEADNITNEMEIDTTCLLYTSRSAMF